MDTKKFMEILDKNVNQEQLMKDLVLEYVMPYLEEKIAGIDLIPGTDIDNNMIAEVIAFVKKQVA